MSIMDPYTCLNYNLFMSVLEANVFPPKLDCRSRPLGLACACCFYCVNLCNVPYLYYYVLV